MVSSTTVMSTISGAIRKEAAGKKRELPDLASWQLHAGAVTYLHQGASKGIWKAHVRCRRKVLTTNSTNI